MQRETRPEKSLSVAEEVHQIRVLAKKLRAYLRLFRGILPEKTLRLEEKRIQCIARELGRARDEEICRQVLRWLATKEKKASHRRWARMALGDLPKTAGRELDARKLLRARRRIEARRLRLLALIDQYPPQEGKLTESLQKEYEKSRRGMREALREGSPEAFHRWRKRVKRLGYLMELFCTSSRRRLGRLQGKLLRLGRLLGRLQDLRVLRGRIEGQAASTDRSLVPLLDKWMTRYRKEAERVGERCLSMGKREFRRLLA
ncbi:hypothetical protein MAMC_01687 [Methylacidimicrobium cyclopophantes]|uniref:CHAD domain-containing protein n=2 Tax=Methylacidimicrobium cyclopophantes TaxID=1041766 RepID=A0A5E6MDC7_9BACT|nr:hypothetical protein MAMC_01687 [Methylacidimicrobium cyclopophantes]